jgi:hypothetical protein
MHPSLEEHVIHMHRRFLGRALAAASGTLLALGVTLITASAHEVFTVAQYRIAVGWEFEPVSGDVTYVGQPNAIQVFVDVAGADQPKGTPVSTLNSDCTHPDFTVTVTFSGVTSSPYCPVPAYDPDTGNGRLDEYDYELIPTVAGTYTFHITGSINGTAINLTAVSGPTTFDSVAEPNDQFPQQLPALNDVVNKVNAIGQREQQDASTASAATSSADDAANRGTILGIIAIAIAVLGSGTSIFIASRRRA